MGSYTSKLFYHGEHDKTKQCNSSSLILENHDTCTPQPQKRKSLIDPRSATLGICRTPIEIIATPPQEAKKAISAVPKHLQPKVYLETNFDTTPTSSTLEKCFDPRSPNVDVPRTPILLETLHQSDTPKFPALNRRSKTITLSEIRQKILGLDPRSPATDFDRTPILKPKSLENMKTRSQENLNTSTYDIKMPSLRLSYCETTTSFDIPEINALPDIVANLNNSQNLENQSSEFSCDSSVDSISNNSAVTVFRNGNEDSLDSSIGSTSSDSPLESPKTEENIENLEAKLVADSDKIIDNVLLTGMKDFESKFNETENKIKIWRDTLSPELQEDSEYDAGSESEGRSELVSPKQELIIEFDDDDCNLVGTIKKADYNTKKSGSGEKKKKNFKKELEAKKLFSPNKKQNSEVKKTEILTNRTPLRNRSNSNSKPHGAVLKSPHLRCKVPFSKKMHQENTPPNGKKGGLKSRLNMTQWDGDSTVII